MNRRNYPDYVCNGTCRYTSFRMMYLAHKSERFNTGHHDPKAFLIKKTKTAIIAQRRKQSQLEGSLSEQRLHHLAQGLDPDDVEAKNCHDTASRPNKKRKMDACGRMIESARGATRGEMYLLVPPCDLLLTAAYRQWLRKMRKIVKNSP